MMKHDNLNIAQTPILEEYLNTILYNNNDHDLFPLFNYGILVNRLGGTGAQPDSDKTKHGRRHSYTPQQITPTRPT